MFGHLCWFIARRDGTETLEKFLKRYMVRQGDGDPPVLLSDGFPTGYLPRPIWVREAPANDLPKDQRVMRQQEMKRRYESSWLTLAQFNQWRRGEDLEPSTLADQAQALIYPHTTTRNWVNRLTDTAGDPFDMREIILPRLTIYWRIEDESLSLVEDFLIDLMESGYGKRKSIGYGQVESFTLPELFSGFADVVNANGFVTLSRFVPAPDDPTDGFWNAVVKYGKVGEAFASDKNPFKKPLVQLECGSCFRDPAPRQWYGQLISGLSWRDEVKQYAFAFPLPIRFLGGTSPE
ncbi:MAG TPA: hypothetical protein VJ464_14055 [Blastocatellia bacterium]|nr:hypothetical protein [Blastocatellia bacterium]